MIGFEVELVRGEVSWKVLSSPSQVGTKLMSLRLSSGSGERDFMFCTTP